MNPTNSSQGGDALGPVGPSTPQNNNPRPDHQTAAANVIRTQIDALYGSRPTLERQETQVQPVVSQQSAQQVPSPQSQPQTQVLQPFASQSAPTSVSAAQTSPQAIQQQSIETTGNPYNRTHTDHPQPQAEQWKAYHSAWQNYYQKYYESYYEHKRAQEAATTATAASQSQSSTNEGYFSNAVNAAQQESPNAIEATETGEDITKNQALYELRQKLLKKVSGRAEKIRRSKHFVPVIAALSVVMIFLFLQYNRVLIATVNAYVSPGSLDAQNIVIDPSATTDVGPDPRLIIPKINVDVPALYGVGTDHASQMDAMAKGVAHFGIPGANSRPGEIGNTVLSGHSSNDLFDQGDYKFIFAQLEKLTKGDTIYANYEGKRYTYVVTKMEVVKPTQVDKLIYPTDKPVMTLITCTPLGTARDRLLVTAEQISPDPATAASAPEGSGQASEGAEIPGSSPTLIERLFGAR